MPSKKLSAQDVGNFRELLLTLRRELTGDIHHLEVDALGDGKPADASSDATDSFDIELSLELLERDEATASRIDAALERIEQGIFGLCESCDGWISKMRLRAMPYAENCIDCQRRYELEAS